MHSPTQASNEAPVDTYLVFKNKIAKRVDEMNDVFHADMTYEHRHCTCHSMYKFNKGRTCKACKHTDHLYRTYTKLTNVYQLDKFDEYMSGHDLWSYDPDKDIPFVMPEEDDEPEVRQPQAGEEIRKPNWAYDTDEDIPMSETDSPREEEIPAWAADSDDSTPMHRRIRTVSVDSISTASETSEKSRSTDDLMDLFTRMRTMCGDQTT
jgi:nitric oxide reductase activation protein